LYRLQKFIPIISISLVIFGAFKVGQAIGGGSSSHKFLFAFMAISVCGAAMYFQNSIGNFRFFCILVCCFWIPLDVRLYRIHPGLIELSPYEAGTFILWLNLLLIKFLDQNPSRKPMNLFLSGPWMVLFIGVFISNFLVGSFSDNVLRTVRHTFLVPMITNILIFNYLYDIRQVKKLLMIFLSSVTVLGCIFLWVPSYFQDSRVTDVKNIIFDTMSSGRLVKVIDFPLFDPLYFNSETGAISFAFVASISFVIALFSKRKLERNVALCFCGIPIYVLIQAQGRTAFVCLLVSLITIVLISGFFKKHSFKKRTSTVIKTVIIIGIALIGMYYKLSDIAYSIALDRFNFLSGNFYNIHGFGERIIRIINSISVYKQHPLFGVGLYGFPLNESGASWYAHNLYLYFLLSFGVVGFLGFMLLLFLYMRLFFRACRQEEIFMYGLIGLCCIMGLLAAGLTSCIFSGQWNSLVFWIPISAAAAACRIYFNSLNPSAMG